MNDKLFKNPDKPDPLGQYAGVRDGVMSILACTATRKSVDSGASVKIEDLKVLTPHPDRG